MMGPVIALLFALAFGGLVGSLIAGLHIKNGWQSGKGPLAQWLDARRRRQFNDQLPAVLTTMSNALKAGFSLSQAIDSVVEVGEAPMSEEFAILQQQLRIGMSFEDALESMTERVGSDDLTLVTTAILVSRRSGGNLTEIFGKISDTIRGRMKIERKVRTLTAQGRLQGIIVSALPFLLGIIMTLMKPQMMIPFLTSGVGLLSVLAMVILIAVGWVMISKIIKIDI